MRSIDDLDGRTIAARKARSIIASLVQDIGRDPSTGERQLAQCAGLLAVIREDLETAWLSGQPIAIADYTALVNAERRVLVTLGLKRIPKDITPRVGALLRS